MNTSLSKLYRVGKGDKVTLKITIGYAQVGTTTVNLGSNKLVSDQKNTFELPIGSGEDLNGKTLYCSTIVADIQKETNQTSVTYELTGGPQGFKQTLQESVENEGAVVFYTATFRFYV